MANRHGPAQRVHASHTTNPGSGLYGTEPATEGSTR